MVIFLDSIRAPWGQIVIRLLRLNQGIKTVAMEHTETKQKVKKKTQFISRE